MSFWRIVNADFDRAQGVVTHLIDRPQTIVASTRRLLAIIGSIAMDLRKLKTLIDLVAESNIIELEVTEGEEKVKIVKAHGGNTVAYAPLAASSVNAIGGASPAAIAPAAEMAAPVVSAKPEGKIIKSPMVGTFYAAPAPDKDDFVKVGSSVKTSQTVCIIEAMKLLNEIEAGFEGAISEILVQNGAAVEFGQPLFVVA
jgi:acetyl-CoA carboxylase biotin carboxyl carrier protein